MDEALLSVSPSELTNGPLMDTYHFQNFSSPSLPKPSHPNSFFKFIVFKNHLRNKPHLHIKRANKLKTRFIWDLFGTHAFLATFYPPRTSEGYSFGVVRASVRPFRPSVYFAHIHTLDPGGGFKRSNYIFFLKLVMLRIKLKLTTLAATW